MRDFGIRCEKWRGTDSVLYVQVEDPSANRRAVGR